MYTSLVDREQGPGVAAASIDAMTARAGTVALLVPLLGICLAAGPAAAQPTDMFVDTVDVKVVEIDVVVTDRRGRPVGGLGREDFEVSVDGAPVEVANFYEQKVFGSDAAPRRGGADPGGARDGRPGPPPPTRRSPSSSTWTTRTSTPRTGPGC